MQLRKKYILALLASGMTLSGMHAEESQAAMSINESAQAEAVLSPEIKSADAESPTSSEGKANATLMSAIESMARLV